MANVHLPIPVVIAGGVACALGGYLVGVVAGPDTPDRTTAVVTSYDSETARLCLTGEAVESIEGVTDDELCGTWQRAGGAATPQEGQDFRFVTRTSQRRDADDTSEVLIYGDVVGGS